MANPNVTLPEPIKVQAEHQATAAGFATVDAYISNLIEMDENARTDSEIDTFVKEGLDSGPSIPWTPALMNSIMENARRNKSQK